LSGPRQKSLVNTVLVVSYFFPPFSGGGIVRIHNFVKYLPLFGIRPIVLAVNDAYYQSTYRDDRLAEEFDPCVEIVRTRSLEPAAAGFRDKIYGVKERTSTDKLLMSVIKKTVNPWLIPDRNAPWLPYAVRTGVRIVREKQIDAVLSTGPPFTDHVAAYAIAKRVGLPLILDYRDDWIGNEYYDRGNPLRRYIERKLEQRIVRRAGKVVCASPESVWSFLRKYPDMDEGKFVHISNGFDPALFGNVPPKRDPDTISFVHTGSLTPKRTPEYFLRATKQLLQERPELARVIRIQFIGYSPLQHEHLADALGMRDIVEFVHNVPQQEVARILSEEAGVCLIFQRQSEGGDTAIPGKLYEYLACRKPILCMADGGATVRLLEQLGCRLITRYDDVAGIKDTMQSIVLDYDRISTGFHWPNDTLKRFSRKEQTEELAALIDETVKNRC